MFTCGCYKHVKFWPLASTVAVFLIVLLQSTSTRILNPTLPHDSSTYRLTSKQQIPFGQGGTSFRALADAQNLCHENGLEVFPNRRMHRKVYDLFLIGTEMDWAEIRLNDLSPHVDYFVILESATTFTNHTKPLHFQENWSRFQKFAPQIIYHVLEDDAIKGAGAWEREHYQRNAMIDQVFPRLLAPQAPNLGDVILVSDVDEIPRPQTVSVLRNCNIPKHVTLNSRWYLYSFQWHALGDDWAHPQATYWQGFKDTPRPEDIRMTSPDIVLQNASWSCTTCFKKVAQVVNKISSFSHQEFNNERFTSPTEIVRRVRNGLDVFDRAEMRYEKVVGNLDVPEYLRANSQRFAYLMDRDPADANFVDWDAVHEKIVDS